MNNFYCAAPWRGLHINPSGDLRTCCSGKPNMLGNLNTHSLADIVTSPVLKEIRQSIKEGIPHAYCHGCVQSEKHGGFSNRTWHLGQNPNFDPATADINDFVPVLIDIRWNTTCNLSCNYCDSWASSKWANIKKIPATAVARKYYTEVCDYIHQHKTQVRQLALVGGEPLLLPENEKLLDSLDNNSECLITLITNLSINLETNKVFKKLLDKPNVNWHISFENIGAQFEYVRHGSEWQTLEKNIKILQALPMVGHRPSIHAVYNLYSATRLVELVSWSKSVNLNINWQGLHQPEYLNPLHHNKAICDLAMDQLDQVLNRTDLIDREREFLTSTRENYNINQTKNLTKEFLNYTKKLESEYHPDQQGQFAKLWPEIYNELNT